MQEHTQQLLTGMALHTRGASLSVFEDPEWDALFDALIRLTQRTSLIIELTGTTLAPKTLKGIIDRKYKATGDKPNRPRGVGKDKSCNSLLQTVNDRFDASYLVSLHFGVVRDGQIETETNFLKALQKRIEIYKLYCSDRYQGSEPRLTFEYYISIVRGIKERYITAAHCSTCGTQHVFNATALDTPKCPVCSLMKLNMSQATATLHSRLSEYQSRAYG